MRVVDLSSNQQIEVNDDNLFLISKGILDEMHMVSPEKMNMIGIDPEPYEGYLPGGEVGVFYQSEQDNNFYEVQLLSSV